MPSNVPSISYAEIQKSFIEVAKRAGTAILAASKDRNTHSISTANGTLSDGTKNNSADLVTETDKHVESLINRILLAKYPYFKFMGEETYAPGTKLGPEPTFVVDPIDGTTNFVHGYPYVSISLGFAYERDPKVGVVFNPFTGVMYGGIKGEGSWRKVIEPCSGGEGCEDDWRVKQERVPLPTKEPTPLTGLDGTLIIFEWGSDRSGDNWKCKLNTWGNLGRSKDEGGAMIHSARCCGSAALNLCAVAEGHVDAYWEGGCWAWDVCAGWVILHEAGGIVVDGNPGAWDIPIDHRKYLAVRGAQSGQKELVEEFWTHVDGTMTYEH